MMHATAAAWILVNEAGAATLVTLLQTMVSLPIFLFALPAGALADMLDKRRVVLGSQLAGFFTAAALTGLAMAGLANATVLLISAFALGMASAFGFPAWQAMLPELVGKSRWPSAITLGSISINLSRSLGPVAGGLLIGLAPPAVVFGINTVSFLAVVIAVATLRSGKPEPAGDAEPFFSSMAAAVRHIRYSPAIRRVLGGQALYIFMAVAPAALLPLIARHLKLQGAAFGALTGVYGMGGILTAFVALPVMRRRWPVDRIFQVSGLAGLLAAGGLAMVDSLAAVVPLLFLAGGAWMASMSQFTIVGQASFPHWVRARASAVQLMVAQGAFALGAMVWGQLTQHGSLHLALGVAAGGLGISVLTGWRWPMQKLLPTDLTPHEHPPRHGGFFREPQPDEGPVLVEVAYRIDPADEPAFFQIMQELRGVRLRDGAFRWGLYHDLVRPGILHEVFLVEDWSTHMRQHARYTVESWRIEQAARQFHKGPEPPAVTHCLRVNLRAAADGIMSSEDGTDR
ncbi:MAG: MFS transporter [Verrucomicrobiaceae bacterium]|nr:MAG: MFS transporter [Verrucomicrobiaceae bacterium]